MLIHYHLETVEFTDIMLPFKPGALADMMISPGFSVVSTKIRNNPLNDRRTLLPVRPSGVWSCGSPFPRPSSVPRPDTVTVISGWSLTVCRGRPAWSSTAAVRMATSCPLATSGALLLTNGTSMRSAIEAAPVPVM